MAAGLRAAAGRGGGDVGAALGERQVGKARRAALLLELKERIAHAVLRCCCAAPPRLNKAQKGALARTRG